MSRVESNSTQSTALVDRRLLGLGVVVARGLGVAAVDPLLLPPLALTLAPAVVMTLAPVLVLAVARAPLRNFLKVMGGRPRPPAGGPPIGAAGAVVVLAVLVVEEVACVDWIVVDGDAAAAAAVDADGTATGLLWPSLAVGLPELLFFCQEEEVGCCRKSSMHSSTSSASSREGRRGKSSQPSLSNKFSWSAKAKSFTCGALSPRSLRMSCRGRLSPTVAWASLVSATAAATAVVFDINHWPPAPPPRSLAGTG